MLCDDLNGKEIQKSGDICVHRTDSPGHGTTEISQLTAFSIFVEFKNLRTHLWVNPQTKEIKHFTVFVNKYRTTAYERISVCYDIYIYIYLQQIRYRFMRMYIAKKSDNFKKLTCN